MKRSLMIVGVLTIAAIVGTLALNTYLANLIAAGVTTEGPRLARTQVTLGATRVSSLAGRAVLRELDVHNPQGWSDDNLVSLGEVRVNVAPLSVFSQPVTLPEIDLDQVVFNYERTMLTSNVGELMRAIEAVVEGETRGKGPPDSGRKSSSIRVGRFRMTNATVSLSIGSKRVIVPIADIDLVDVGKNENGVTSGQVVAAMMRRVVVAIATVTASRVVDFSKASGTAAADNARKSIQGLKDLFRRNGTNVPTDR